MCCSRSLSSWWHRAMTTFMLSLPTLTCTSLTATSSSGSPQVPCKRLSRIVCSDNTCLQESAMLLLQDVSTCAYVRRSRSTHWKQTVLYLQESIVICEGEVITGIVEIPLGDSGKDSTYEPRLHSSDQDSYCGLFSHRSQQMNYWFVGLAGSMSCTPNASNPRDLDLSLKYSFKGKNGSCSATQSYRMR